ADVARVRPAALPRPPPGAGLLARPAHGCRLGLHLLHGHVHRHRPHATAPCQGRGGPLRAALAPDRVGRRIPVPAMKLLWAILLLALGAVAAAGVSALVYGPAHALGAAAFFAACGAPVLALSHLLARHRCRVGSLSRQFAVAVSLVFGLVLAGVGA